ncbi:MAG: hypothetical protein V1664_05485 [Candidatus Uhrbacteria bacterium]
MSGPREGLPTGVDVSGTEILAAERRNQEQIECRPTTANDLYLASEAAISSLRNRLARNSRALDYLTIIDSRLTRFLLEENSQRPSVYAQALVGDDGIKIDQKDLQEINRIIIAELNPLLVGLSQAIKDHNALTKVDDPTFNLSEGSDGLLQALRVGEVDHQRTTSIFGFFEGWDFTLEAEAHGRLVVLDPLADKNYWLEKKRVFEKCQKRKIETGEFIGLRSADAIFELEAFAREVESGGKDDAEKTAEAARTIANFIDERLDVVAKNPVKAMAQTDFFHGDFDEIIDVLNAAEVLKRKNPRLYARLLGVGQSPKTSEAQKSDLFGNFFHLAVARSERFVPKNVRGSKGLVGRQVLLGYLDGLTDIDNRQLPFHHVNVEQMEKMQKNLKKKMHQAQKSDDPQVLKEAENQLAGSVAPLVVFSREKELHDFFAAVARQEKENDPLLQLKKLERAARRFSNSDRFNFLFKIAGLKRALGIEPKEILDEARRLADEFGDERTKTDFFEKSIEFQIASGQYFEVEESLEDILTKGGFPYESLFHKFVEAAIKDQRFSLVRRLVKKSNALSVKACFGWLYDVLKAEASLGLKIDFSELDVFAERMEIPKSRSGFLWETSRLKAKAGKFDEAWKTIEDLDLRGLDVGQFNSRNRTVNYIIGEEIKAKPLEQVLVIFKKYKEKLSKLDSVCPVLVTNHLYYSYFAGVLFYLLENKEFLKAAELFKARGQTVGFFDAVRTKFDLAEVFIEAGLITEAKDALKTISAPDQTDGRFIDLSALINAREGNFEAAVGKLSDKTLEAIIDLALATGHLVQAKELIDKKTAVCLKKREDFSKEVIFRDYKKLALAQAAAGQVDEAKKTIRKYFPADRGKPALAAELAKVDLMVIENLPAVLMARQENEHLAEVEREARGLFGENFFGIEETKIKWFNKMAYYNKELLNKTYGGLEEAEFRREMQDLKEPFVSLSQRKAVLESLAEKMTEPEFVAFISQPENLQAVKDGKWYLTLTEKAGGEFVWNLRWTKDFFDTIITDVLQ